MPAHRVRPEYSVPCTKCGAQIGERCRGKMGQLSTYFHRERTTGEPSRPACPCGGGELHYLCR